MSGAVFSDCRQFRYSLWRRWEDAPLDRLVAFIALNPSTADETKNDPTVTRCINFAKGWGFGGMVMLNAFSFRATDPRDMKRHRWPVGWLNDAAIGEVAKAVGGVCLAWGIHGSHLDRAAAVRELLVDVPYVWHLGLTKSGQPRHPLYIKGTTERILHAPEMVHREEQGS